MSTTRTALPTIAAASGVGPLDALRSAVSLLTAAEGFAPVLDIAEVAADAQFGARGAFVEAVPPGGAPRFRQLAPLLAGAPRRERYDLPDPAATETAELLAEAGLPTDEIESLLAEGVIA